MVAKCDSAKLGVKGVKVPESNRSPTGGLATLLPFAFDRVGEK